MKKYLSLISLLALATASGQTTGTGSAKPKTAVVLTPIELTCEALKNPEGIDARPPRLSWKLASDVDGSRQTAYQILASSSPEKLAADEGSLWDTGKVDSAETLWIKYAGKPLKSRDQVWWKVRAWDEEGRESAWSEPASFTMGLLDRADWQARWISDTFGSLTLAASRSATESVGPDWLNGGFDSQFETGNAGLVMEPCWGSDSVLLNTRAATAASGFTISATLQLNTQAPTGWAGLVFGYRDFKNYFLLRFNGAGNLQLLERKDGETRLLQNAGRFDFEKNALVRLSLVVPADAPPIVTVREVADDKVLLEQPLKAFDLPQGLAGLYANIGRFTKFEFETKSAPDSADIAGLLATLQSHSKNPPREVNHKLEDAARFALETPKIQTTDLGDYDADKLDYGMALGIEGTPKGRIWAAWNPGSDGPEGFIVAATSDDRGETWSKTRLAINNRDPAHQPLQRSTMHGIFWTAPDGRLWLFFDQAMDKWDGRAGVWVAVCANPDDETPVWSTPVRIADGFPIRKPIVLSNGEWLLPLTLHHFDVGTFHELDPMRKANVYASTDHGKTWEYRGGVRAPKPHCDEPNLVELKDGRIWMTQRTAEGLFESFSEDGGRTWTDPVRSKTIVQPTAMHFVRRLASGNLLLIKNGFEVDKMPPGNRVGMTAFLSDDEGKSWKGGLVLDRRGRVSHPDAFQAADETIFAVNDYERPKAGEVLIHRFREEDVLNRKIVTPGSKLGGLIFKPRPEVLKARLEAEARGERPPKQ